MPNKHCAIAAAALLGSWSLSSLGQEPGHEQACPEASDEASHAQFIEEVLVVGTRRAGREIDTLPVPVDILDAEQLGAQGNGDMLDALASLIPSYNVGREPISDAATLVRPANLRGLPADNTLVLVNGKRRHRSAVIGEFISGINKGAQGCRPSSARGNRREAGGIAARRCFGPVWIGCDRRGAQFCARGRPRDSALASGTRIDLRRRW